MFRGLSINPNDLFPIPIPIWKQPQSNSIPVIAEHRTFHPDKIEAIITTYVQNTAYLKFLDWSSVYITQFPSNFNVLPSIIFYSPYTQGICVNADLATANFDIEKNQLKIEEYSAFATCILFGINKLLLMDLNDEDHLTNLYSSLCMYVYSIFIRSYIRDYDLKSLSDQELATIYFLFAKLVGLIYFSYSGNLNALASSVTLSFFMKSKITGTRSRVNTKEFPIDVKVETFNDVFEFLENVNIINGLSIEDFRSKIIRFFSLSTLMCMSSGIELVSMLSSCKIASQVFNNKVSSISPMSTTIVMKTVFKYMSELVEKKSKESDFYLDNPV